MVERRELPATSEVPFIDLLRDTWPPFQEQWMVCTCCAAFLTYVPMFVVGIPACFVAFIIAAVVAIVNKELVTIALLPIGLVAALLFAGAYNAVRAGWTKMLLQLARNEGRLTFADLKGGMPWFWDFFVTMLIIGLGTAFGTMLLVVPGILFAVRSSLAPFLVIDENMSPMDAIAKSNELVTGYSWQILGYLLIMFFANTIISFIPLVQFVALPAAMAFLDLALTRIYLYRKQELKLLQDR